MKTKFNPKGDIMKLFRAYSIGNPISLIQLKFLAQRHGLELPPNYNQHISQLCRDGKLERHARGIYSYPTNHSFTCEVCFEGKDEDEMALNRKTVLSDGSLAIYMCLDCDNLDKL